MGKRVHGIVTTTTLFGLVLALSAGYVWYYHLRLPHPARAELNDLMRWVVTRDLRREPLELRSVLVIRLEEELLRQPIDLSAASAQLSCDQKSRIQENAIALVRPWLEVKMNQYYATEPSGRLAEVDRLLDSLERLQDAARCLREPKDTVSMAEVQKAVVDEVEQWKSAVSAEEQARIDGYVSVVQARWLMRWFGWLQPAASR